MKRLFVALFLVCFSSVAFAQSKKVSLRFDDMLLSQLVKVLVGEVLERPYVLDASLPAVSVSVVLPESSAQVVERELSAVLRRVGFLLDCGQNVCRVLPSSADVREVVFYRPKFRSVQYMQTALQPWFPVDSFGGSSRGAGSVMSPAPASLGAAGQGGGQGQAVAQVPTQNAQTGSISMTPSASDVLAFRGVPEDVKKFNALVSKLDIEELQVVVTAMVYEVQLTTRDGTAWDLIASMFKGKLDFSYSSGAKESANLSLKIFDADLFVSALRADSRFKVVASPRLRVLSGRSARFSVGDDVPVLGSVVVDAGKAVQSVNYKSSGVILDIQAEVFQDMARLGVTQQISQFSVTETGVVASPTLTKRELKTDLFVKFGDVVLLGGLDQDKQGSASSALPFLRFFKSESSSTARTQIMVVLSVERG